MPFDKFFSGKERFLGPIELEDKALEEINPTHKQRFPSTRVDVVSDAVREGMSTGAVVADDVVREWRH